MSYKETCYETFTGVASRPLEGSSSSETDWCSSYTHQRRLSFSNVNHTSSPNVSIFNSTPKTAKSKVLTIIAELDFDFSRRSITLDNYSSEMNTAGVCKKAEEKLKACSLSGNKRKKSLRERRRTSVSSPSDSCLATRTIHASAPPIPESPARLLLSLYTGNPSPHPEDTTVHDNHSKDKVNKFLWKKNHFSKHKVEENDFLLPFSREVAGLYSCYGVEPLLSIQLSESVDVEYDEEAETFITSKINQDRGGIAFPYGSCSKSALFSVYDGHGEGGENIAQYSLSEIQRRLELHPDFHRNISRAFKDTFLAVNQALSDEETIEPYHSGSTACVVLLRSNKLITANVGDSRAVIGRSKANHGKLVSFQAIDLSIDQNPDSHGEMERIQKLGGFVSPSPEPGFSSRVWLDKDFTKVGLAMSRSIGDFAVKTVGVIADPVVSSYNLTDHDEFLILATDGVWEFLSSQNAVDIVGSSLNQCRGATYACQRLIEAAAEKWNEEEEGNYRDDITAIVVHLKDVYTHTIEQS